jgi:hypothetical protein
MPRFFLHLKQGSELIVDHEGSIVDNAAEAYAEAVRAAREICAEAVKSGKHAAIDAFILADEAGKQVRFVPVADLLAEDSFADRTPRRRNNDGDREIRTYGAPPDGFERSYSEMARFDRLRTEIQQSVRSCQRAIGDIRRQLEAVSR